ncbi:MAG: hypothetical protein M3Q49_08900 [Actinomycetota bacterium]|nr:hypothetical protein [Actinomycetota bacterium]
MLLTQVFTERRENNKAQQDLKAQRQREAHERRMQEQQLEHQRRSWLLSERRRAYAKLAEITSTVDTTGEHELQDLSEALSEIEMLSDSGPVIESARMLHGAQFWARRKGHELVEEDQPLLEDEEYRRLHETKDTYRENFIRNARYELGLDMRPGQPEA